MTRSATKSYDNADRLLTVVNTNSSNTTLSSFSYVLDSDGRRSSVTEADGSAVSYTYDWGGGPAREPHGGRRDHDLCL